MSDREKLIAKPPITVDLLRELLDCDFATGQLVWKKRRRDLFPSSQACNAWNTARAGKLAFTSANAYGYKNGTIFSQTVRAHNVIWALYTGDWPAPMVDHINGDPADNRIDNLRAATPSVNMKNTGMSIANTSGVVGVHQRGKRWVAYIRVNGKPITLGSFRGLAEAAAAREAANQKYGYSETHGKRPSYALSVLILGASK